MVVVVEVLGCDGGGGVRTVVQIVSGDGGGIRWLWLWVEAKMMKDIVVVVMGEFSGALW